MGDCDGDVETIRVGDTVLLSGLRKRLELNGRRGCVVAKVQDGERWSVKLDIPTSSGKNVALKRENMIKVEKDDPVAGETSSKGKAPRFVTCPLCKKKLLAKSEAECQEHMASCPAFLSLYGESESVSLERQSDAVVEGLGGIS